MDSVIELIVTTTITGNTANGVIDLYGDEPIQLNLSCADIKDIKVRKGSFTQSFVVPGTANNNKLFNYIFEIGINSQFNPAKSTPCQLLVDTIPVLNRGVLQLTGIAIDDQKNISYEVTIFDESGSLIDSLGTNELTDLDFTELNHIWNHTNVVNTWTGTSKPYIYPLIDYGFDFNIADMNSGTGVQLGQIYPAIQAKYVFDKIFAASGYSYTSNFLNSNYFKNLYIPYNGNINVVQDATFIALRSFQAIATGDTAIAIPFGNSSNNLGNYNISEIDLPFSDTSTYPGFDTGSLYNISTHKYTANIESNQTFSVSLDYSLADGSGGGPIVIPTSQFTANFYRSGYSNTVPYCSVSYNIGLTNGATALITSLPLNGGPNDNQFRPTLIGETFWVKIASNGIVNLIGGSGSRNLTTTIGHTSRFFNTVNPTLTPNTSVIYNTMIPKKVKQVDFINNILLMHNLYVIPDKQNPKKLTIEPRDDYYATGKLHDWSSKIDLSQPVSEVLLSEQQNNRIVFTYTADKDYYNDNYTTSTTRIFGDSYTQLDNDFTKDDQTIQVTFAPTPSVAVLDSNIFVPAGVTGSTANDFVIPKIGKVDSNLHFGSTDFTMRILQKNNSTLLPLTETWLFDGTLYNSYPYLGMLDHPFSGTTDLGFGTVNYEYYILPSITSNNLVNKYYGSYLNEIINPNGKLITCSIYLTPSDIQNFNFNDTIFIDSLASNGMGSYFFVNNIQYNPTVNNTSVVELIQTTINPLPITTNPITSNPTNPLQTISIAGGRAASPGSIAIGTGVNVGPRSSGNIAIGKNINIGGGTQTSFIMGSGSTVGGNSSNSFAIGNNNIINSNNLNTFAFGNNNIIGTSGATGNTTGNTITNVTVFGNNISATTSNTVYVNNLQVTSGGTINNVSISAITIGGSLWTTGSTGIQNIKAVNASTIDTVGQYTYAEGADTFSSGYTAHAEGDTTTAIGDGAHAEGGVTLAQGDGAHSEGLNTQAINDAAHSEGTLTIASGYNSHAEGFTTTANGLNSHAEGSGTTASGDASHAEGQHTTASGVNSHAEGKGTIAFGNWSHAEGNGCGATNSFAHAGGLNAAAQNTGEWARSSGGSVAGDQYGTVSLFVGTTTATPVQAFVGVTGSEKFLISTSSARYCRIYVVVVDTGTINSKQFKGEGLIKNIAGTSLLVGTFTMTSTNGDAALTTASIAVTAGGATQDLVVTVTGVAATSLDWFIRIDYEQVF